MKKPDRNKMVFLAVSVALVICIAYIAMGEYQKFRNQDLLEAYQQGAQAGYEQAVIQLMQQVATCNQVPVTFNNQTINVVAVACLQQAQGG